MSWRHPSDERENRIDGEFDGWSGDTKFNLMNGQVWEQVSYSYWYHYAYNPRVVIYQSDSGYKLRLADDDDHSIRVHRVCRRSDESAQETHKFHGQKIASAKARNE